MVRENQMIGCDKCGRKNESERPVVTVFVGIVEPYRPEFTGDSCFTMRRSMELCDTCFRALADAIGLVLDGMELPGFQA